MARPIALRRYLRFTVLAALGLLGCSGPTEITLVITTDVPSAEGRAVAFTFGPPGATENRPPAVVTERAWGEDGQVGTLVVLPSRADDAELAIRVTLASGRDPETCSMAEATGCIIARRQLKYLPHQAITLPISLRARCEGQFCEENTTCNSLGLCVPAPLDAEDCHEKGGAACLPEGDAPGDATPGGLCSGSLVFADPGLEAAVRDALGQADGDIAAEDAVNLITLDATYRSIAVLDGIECLSGLQALSLDFNQITDIAPLALLGASSLSYLNLRGNQVQDLEPLSQLSALTGLSIDGNQVSDLSPLSALLSLDDLAPCKQRGE
jgi:hypothetical protein